MLIFSGLCLSVVVKMQLYPFTAAASANPIPVLPDVPSMMVPPGFRIPAASASSTIFSEIRSFTEDPGLKYSTFAKKVGDNPSATAFRRTIGVFPIVSRMDEYHMAFKLRYLGTCSYPCALPKTRIAAPIWT